MKGGKKFKECAADLRRRHNKSPVDRLWAETVIKFITTATPAELADEIRYRIKKMTPAQRKAIFREFPDLAPKSKHPARKLLERRRP